MPAPTRITRLAERASYDRATLDAILDAAYVAHVGVVVDGAPAVIPIPDDIDDGTACALMLQGSLIADGTQVCATVTHLDGLVLARSAFHSSMNYRSAAVHGVARVVDDPGEKVRYLDALVDQLLPGRRTELRAMDDGELLATQVVAIPLDTFSAKIRTGGPKDAPEDHLPGVWGGVIPLTLAKGVPQADDTTAPGVAAPRLTA